MSPERPYITITGDTHAGAAIDMYRDYLDPAWRAYVDGTGTWRGRCQPSSSMRARRVGPTAARRWSTTR